MKYSVFTVVLPDLTIEQQAKAIAESGYEGVEWRVTTRPMEYRPGEPFNFWSNRLEDIWVGEVVKEAPRLRRLAEENGLETVSLAGYSQCSDMEAMTALCQACEIIGARFFRVHVRRYDGTISYNTLYKEAARDLARVAQMAAQRGLRACIELHPGTIYPSAGLAHRMLVELNPASVGVIYDAGNLPNEGYEETKMALELLGEYLAYVHVKDTAWVRAEEEAESQGAPQAIATGPTYLGAAGNWQAKAVAPGEGLANWPKVVAVLKALGYEGWLSNEDFRYDPPAKDRLRQDLEYLKRLQEEVS